MNSSGSIEELESTIRELYRSDATRAETLIERYLGERLQGLEPSEKLMVLDEVSRTFQKVPDQGSPEGTGESNVVARLFSLFLGKQVSKVDLSSAEFLERLANSLNTVFDALNEIVAVINRTLLGKQAELETIRQIIGTDLHDELGGSSLEDYLAQIRKAFLTSHQAFQQAAAAKVGEILHELDPGHIADSETGGLKIGPLKKAGLFDLYQERFRRIQKYFDSGRFSEDLLREFEKSCRRLHETRRENP